MKSLLCGLDVGTSAVKTVIFDRQFNQLQRFSGEYELLNRGQNRAELDPREVFSQTLSGIQDAVRWAKKNEGRLEFIAFSCQLHSLILLDEQEELLTDCLIWADTRAMKYHKKLTEIYDRYDLYQKTGCPAHAMYPPAKLYWYKQEEPELYQRAEKFVSLKEYIIKKLTGRQVVDFSLASASGFLNLHDREWVPDFFSLLDLSADNFSEIKDGRTILQLNQKYSKKTGADVPLVLGSGDGPLANLGAGTISSREFVATIGTSGAVRVFADRPVLDDQQRTWCYFLDKDVYLPGGAINNGGLVLSWLEENMARPEETGGETRNFYEIIDNYMAHTEPGSRGLIFLPFLAGERAPGWNPDSRGLIFGLDLDHSWKDVARAAVEGVTFRLKAITDALEDLTGSTDRVLVNGGFTNSDPWLQITADILNKKIIAPECPDASARGAALMGAVACGLLNDYDQVEFDPTIKAIKEPNPDVVPKYADLYEKHCRIYEANRPFMSGNK